MITAYEGGLKELLFCAEFGVLGDEAVHDACFAHAGRAQDGAADWLSGLLAGLVAALEQGYRFAESGM